MKKVVVLNETKEEEYTRTFRRFPKARIKKIIYEPVIKQVALEAE